MHYLLIVLAFSLNLMAADKPNVVIILTDDLDGETFTIEVIFQLLISINWLKME